MEHVVLENQ